MVSTTGQGDLPTNSRIFWKSLLRRKLSQGYLRDVNFTTFGLGDKSYPKYNWAARKLHKRLLQLGGLEAYPRGEADEQHEEGLDASFVPWSTNLRLYLLSQFPLPDGLTSIPEHTLLKPKWLLRAVEVYSNGSSSNGHNEYRFDAGKSENGRRKSPSHTISESFSDGDIQRLSVDLQANHRVTPASHWQDVRHLTFTSQTSTSYGPGDVLTVHPQNPSSAVNEVITLMGWTDVADRAIEFIPTMSEDANVIYPPPPITVFPGSNITLRYLLTNHLDLTAIPRRSFFSMIAHFTSDQFQKDRLLEFADPKYVDELYDYTTRPRRSILEVLQEFETVKIPWQWAASSFPELRGRQFSIASGGHLKTSADGSARFELLVAIVKYKTVIKKVREGVCTKYLAGLKAGDRLSVTLQKGGLGITKADFQTPVIMIGPGTGIAPLRSLIWERMLWQGGLVGPARMHHERSTMGNVPLGSNLLFFGGRNQSADYFYKDEWDTLRSVDALQIYPVFSRDQKQKHYVQDAIREHSDEIYDLLRFKGAIVYVCGSSGKMPIAVRAALLDVIRESAHAPDSSQIDEEAALSYMEKMEKDGRYKQETW